MLEYRIIPDNTGLSEYFVIDPLNGNIKAKRSLDGITEQSLPIHLTIEARDNPAGKSNVAMTEVVVSIVFLFIFYLFKTCCRMLINTNIVFFCTFVTIKHSFKIVLEPLIHI
jgi:hypothetical protein